MQNDRTNEYIVLGGGVAGLTFAREASRQGQRVVVIEKEAQVGGLSRTLVFGDYRFDIGGHRLASPWPHVIDWAREVVSEDLLEVVRSSHIFLGGRYIHYPLKLPNALFAFSFPKAIQILSSYLRASLRRRDHQANASFEDWVISRFGRSLYDIYFRPYTEKVWGVQCRELASDHAVRRIRVPSLSAAIKGSLFRHTAKRGALVSRFLYPPLGFGVITDRLAEQARVTGLATIHLNSRTTRLECNPATGMWHVYYQQDGQEHGVTGRQVISTLPVGSLLSMLPPVDESVVSLGNELSYRGVICVFLALDGSRITSDTWTYFPDKDLVFGRIHEPVNWSPQMAPKGKTSLVAEIFCSVGDAVWQCSDAEVTSRTVDDLARLTLVDRDRVADAWVLRAPYAYPVYRVGYADKLRRVHEYLSRWPTLHLTGRTGAFRYLNADAVIEQVLELVDYLMGGGWSSQMKEEPSLFLE